MKKVIISSLCLMALTGCISREQADKRLERGCAAAAEMFLSDNFSIKKIKSAKFKPSSELGNNYREVMIFALETDEWAEIDKEYKCIFAEENGPFGSSHRASIYQVIVDGQTYGIKGNEILGNMQTHMKLNEAVERAMMR